MRVAKPRRLFNLAYMIFLVRRIWMDQPDQEYNIPESSHIFYQINQFLRRASNCVNILRNFH